MIIATASMLIGSVIGISLGMAAGFYGGWSIDCSMRLAEVQTAMPMFLIAILLIILRGRRDQLVAILPTRMAHVCPHRARRNAAVAGDAVIEAAIAVGCTGAASCGTTSAPSDVAHRGARVISTDRSSSRRPGCRSSWPACNRRTSRGSAHRDGRPYLACVWLPLPPGSCSAHRAVGTCSVAIRQPREAAR